MDDPGWILIRTLVKAIVYYNVIYLNLLKIKIKISKIDQPLLVQKQLIYRFELFNIIYSN